ncbi:hypothetical protein IVB33_18880 [Bradyrhizobium sp. 24]|uniref:hypothetical protein n=1 Tax=unclassified Bradyrhizobium TaxID=2631580 RepID=UPI001FF91FD9|nr:MULTISPECIES: hypothetical protein [unclassified Bradyrhizobium]MCK1299602.1 hypothetical protein [Bradyrhizobium sp. 37]MCK1379583.1 hypothetical protein [Bradyrhizobium sp. 24]MCK1769380.1 hypothetical protein [Bradyrhizobium sp. 134]
MLAPSDRNRGARQAIGNTAVEGQRATENAQRAIRLANDGNIHCPNSGRNLDIDRGKAPPARTWAQIKYLHYSPFENARGN